MRAFVVTLILLAAGGYAAWQSRVEILVWALPHVLELTRPIAPNVPTAWPEGPDVAAAPPGRRPPNVILILADDLGFNDVSLYNGGAGDGSLMTPNIDALARAGVTFTNGYAANAVCAPSRATLLTGRYSTRFGFEFAPFFKVGATIFQWMQDLDPVTPPPFIDHVALDALPPMQDQGMPPGEVTIAEVLRDAGYYTAHIGKWHLGSTEGLRPEDQGFADSLYLSDLLYLPTNHPEAANARRHGGIERMAWANARYGAQFNGSAPFAPQGYLTDYYTDEAVAVIERNRNRPFFLFLAHWAPHIPLQALKSDYDALAHIDDHHLRVYSAMIRALDRGVGRVVDALEANGLSDDTLIVFSSDNGGAGYVGLPDVNRPYRGWKLTHFEGGTHVPFAMKWPARIEAGTTYAAPVHHVDVFHTIAAAAGAPVPADRKLDGVDLVPFVNGVAAGVPHETLFWRQGYQQTVLHQGWKLIRTDRPENGRWLFELRADPTERTNLAARRPDMLARLEALLDAHDAEQAAPMWPSVNHFPVLVDKHGEQPYEDGDEYIYWPN